MYIRQYLLSPLTAIQKILSSDESISDRSFSLCECVCLVDQKDSLTPIDMSKDQQGEKNEQTKISLEQIHLSPLKVSRRSLSSFDLQERSILDSRQFLDAQPSSRSISPTGFSSPTLQFGWGSSCHSQVRLSLCLSRKRETKSCQEAREFLQGIAKGRWFLFGSVAREAAGALAKVSPAVSEGLAGWTLDKDYQNIRIQRKELIPRSKSTMDLLSTGKKPAQSVRWCFTELIFFFFFFRISRGGCQRSGEETVARSEEQREYRTCQRIGKRFSRSRRSTHQCVGWSHPSIVHLCRKVFSLVSKKTRLTTDWIFSRSEILWERNTSINDLFMLLPMKISVMLE